MEDRVAIALSRSSAKNFILVVKLSSQNIILWGEKSLVRFGENLQLKLKF